MAERRELTDVRAEALVGGGEFTRHRERLRAPPRGQAAASERPQRVEDHHHVDRLLEDRARDRGDVARGREAHRDDREKCRSHPVSAFRIDFG